ncbi:MAG TPA: hypothetical protein VFW67_17015 [Burkholderiaceae bacterium]|nr:hypothetical protein [Burkholderiaceae bacterium]
MVQASAESPGRRHLVQALARLLAAHPAWVLAHAQGYAELGLEQAQMALAQWRRRLALQLLAGACAMLAVALAGVAAMLWATAPLPASPRLWVLVLVPLLPAFGALALTQAARSVPDGGGLTHLRQQWAADLAVLREASAP